jgi:hypothetical protein
VEWIKISERLPQDMHDVICYFNDTEEVGEATFHFDSEEYFFYVNGHGMVKKEYVSHWMPLPEPPKNKQP